MHQKLLDFLTGTLPGSCIVSKKVSVELINKTFSECRCARWQWLLLMMRLSTMWQPTWQHLPKNFFQLQRKPLNPLPLNLPQFLLKVLPIMENLYMQSVFHVTEQTDLETKHSTHLEFPDRWSGM